MALVRHLSEGSLQSIIKGLKIVQVSMLLHTRKPIFSRKTASCMQLARAQGDFLLVGLHTDDDVMERRGAHLPIMDLHERALSVLACCYVNEVIIGACRVPTYGMSLLHLLAWPQTALCRRPSLVTTFLRTCPESKQLYTLLNLM